MINAADVLDKHNWQQEILCTNFVSRIWTQPPITYPSNTQLQRIPIKTQTTFLNYLYFIVQVLRHIDPSADIIMAYDMHALLPARMAAWRYRKPLVYHIHDYAENRDRRSLSIRLLKIFERLFAKTADLLVVPDKQRADVIVRELNLPSPPLIVANSSLNPPAAPTTDLQNALHKLGKQFDKIVFRPGRVGPGHSIDITIRSIPMWAGASWGFVVMGPCEESHRHWLEQTAAEVGVVDRFVILPPVSYTEVLNYTSGASLGHGIYEPIHVNHRYSTTASNKTMEYIAVGLPILLSDSESDRALVERYGNGLTVPHDSPQAIAAAVNHILGNSELAQQMSEGSRRAFQEEFNYEHQYLPVIERMQEIIEQRRR